MKIKNLIILTIVLLVFNSHCLFAKDLYLPEEINSIKMGLKYDEFKNIFLEAKEVVKSSSKVLTSYFFKNDELWTGALFGFDNEELFLIGLTKYDKEETNSTNIIKKNLPLILKKALLAYGNKFEKKLSCNDDNTLEPVLIWRLNDVTIFLSCTPEKLYGQIKTPNVSMKFIKSNQDYSEYINVQPDGTSGINFNDLLSDEIKQILSDATSIIKK
jgi:hypothetical protein